MEDFAALVAKDLEAGKYARVLLDLRNNGGGSDGVLYPILMWAAGLVRQGHTVYGLIGEATFSSTIINAVEIQELGGILAGSPTSGSADHYGSTRGFTLPHSGIRVSCSQKFIDLETLFEAGVGLGVESLTPDLPVEQTLTDALAGRDTLVDGELASFIEKKLAEQVDFCFCAVDMKKEEIRALEERYAKLECPVVSNNSAHRWTEDVPMVVPEINADHIKIIDAQRRRLGTKRGFIAVKSNCSIQSYAPLLTPLMKAGYEIDKVLACTYQAISGAGKTFKDWPEMVENVIPYIGGEEEKSEQEPLRILGRVEGGEIVKAEFPKITCQCIRVPVLNGHTAAVFVKFKKKPTKEQLIRKLAEFKGLPQELELPSAPKQFIKYMEEDNRPQVQLDVDYENGMGVTVGRIREDKVYDFKFVGLSHNTVRGAAGGAVLCAETLTAKGYIKAK